MVEWTAYVDESGKDGQSADFVLACITGSPENMTKLSAGMRGFKRGLMLGHDPDTWELHGKNIMLGHDRQKNQSFRTRSFTKKLAIFDAVVDLVCELDISILGTLIANTQLSKKYHQNKTLEYAITVLFGRLEQFVHTRPIDTIHLVSDRVLPYEKKIITTAFNNSRRGNSSLSATQTSHVTGIEYVDSQDNVLIQAADIVAYVINRYRNGDENFANMFAKLTEPVKTHDGGVQHPLVIF